MKPFLIRNYDKVLQGKKDEFLELFMQEADVWEKLYVKEEYKPEAVEEERTQRGHSVFRRLTVQSKQRNSVRSGGPNSPLGGRKTLTSPGSQTFRN